MQILMVKPKDVSITFEMSLTELTYLLDFINASAVEYEKKDLGDAVKFVKDVFFPELDKLEKEVKNNYGS